MNVSNDGQSYAPIHVVNQLESEWKDVRLSFGDWDALLVIREQVRDCYNMVETTKTIV
jgi:hypothetical protein